MQPAKKAANFARLFHLLRNWVKSLFFADFPTFPEKLVNIRLL